MPQRTNHPAPRRIQWTERDLIVLPWIGEQYAVRFDQLHILLSRQPLGTTKEAGQVAASTVRSCLARWKGAGLVQTASLVIGEPGWVWLTREGLRQVGLDYPLWQVSLSAHLDHLFACNVARLWVEAHEPEAEWRSERALRAAQAWTQAGVRLGHRPSAEVTLETGTVAVEVTGALEQAQRVREALPDLLTRYPGCWYVVGPRARPVLSRLLAELGPAVQAQVRLIELTQVRELRTSGPRAPR
jgi:hypothetical protein